MEKSEEEWREIKDFNNYLVSNTGKIKSVKFKKHTLLKPSITSGYPRVVLRRDGKNFNKYVHRLVGASFVENQNGKPEINHKNLIKTDNRVENLEWVTPRENTKHAKLNNKRGGNHKLDDIKKLTILTLKGAMPVSEIMSFFNISQPTVYKVFKNG